MKTAQPPRRDRDACNALIVQYRPLVWYVYARLRRRGLLQTLDSEDALSVGLVALWRAARNWEEGRATFANFGYQSIRNNLLRTRPQLPHVSLDGLWEKGFRPAAPTPDNPPVRFDTDQAAAALEDLEPRDRDVLVALYLEGVQMTTLAARWGVTKQRVHQLRDRALNRLRAALTRTETTSPAPPAQPSTTPAPSEPSPILLLERFRMTTTNPTALLTIHDLANRLSVARRTIWRWLEQGRLPAPLRLSKTCIRWRPEDIDAHLAKLADLEQPAGA